MMKRKELVLIIVGLGLLLIAITGITYAAFSYSKAGEKVNTITTGVMVMSYTESSNVISITNALPTTDATGKKLSKSGEYFDFSVASTVQGQALISYEIGAKKQSGNTIDENNIKLYLTEKNSDGTETEVTAPRVYREETSANSYTGRPVDEMSLYTGTINNNVTRNYRLRMWVNENYNPQGDGGNLSFKVKVNVYGKSGNNSMATVTYGYTGTAQTFMAPQTGTYKIELWGAQGGTNGTYIGGKGAYTTGELSLTKGDVLYIYVGSQGEANNTITNIGGYNGGGYSGNNTGAKSYGGGGATDIRLTSGTWNDTASLASRLMVASGGGGAVSGTSKAGGAGGALIGAEGTTDSNSLFATDQYPAGGGTQTSAGPAYSSAKKGAFGYASQVISSAWGGGGGSGYYGGAAGCGRTGGGGSSYISGYTGCVAITSASSISPRKNSSGATCADGTTDITCSYHYSGKKFVNPVMKAGDDTMPTYDGDSTMTGNRGHGFAKISLVS